MDAKIIGELSELDVDWSRSINDSRTGVVYCENLTNYTFVVALPDDEDGEEQYLVLSEIKNPYGYELNDWILRCWGQMYKFEQEMKR